MTTVKGEYSVSTEMDKLDLAFIHRFLAEDSYWAQGIPFEQVEKAAEHSLNFGVYHLDQQVGYARVVTDYVRIAYLADVFIIPAYRGKGLSKFLMEQIMTCTDLRVVRRWLLVTTDAQGLYKQFGWSEISDPEKYMQVFNKESFHLEQR